MYIFEKSFIKSKSELIEKIFVPNVPDQSLIKL